MWGASATYFLAKDTVQFLKKEKGISFIFFYYSLLQWEVQNKYLDIGYKKKCSRDMS